MRIYKRPVCHSGGEEQPAGKDACVFQQHKDTRIIQRNDAERAKE